MPISSDAGVNIIGPATPSSIPSFGATGTTGGTTGTKPGTTPGTAPGAASPSINFSQLFAGGDTIGKINAALTTLSDECDETSLNIAAILEGYKETLTSRLATERKAAERLASLMNTSTENLSEEEIIEALIKKSAEDKIKAAQDIDKLVIERVGIENQNLVASEEQLVLLRKRIEYDKGLTAAGQATVAERTDQIDSEKNLLILEEKARVLRKNRSIHFAEAIADANKAVLMAKIERGYQPTLGDVGRTIKDRVTYGPKEAARDGLKSIDNFAEQFPDRVAGALSDAITGAKDFREAIVEIFADLGQDLMRDALKIGVKSLIGAIASNFSASSFSKGGEVKGYATGGKVTGGSGIRDDVSANLSAGEYVVRKASVNKYGSDFMEKLNRGALVKRAGGGSADIKEQLDFTYDNQNRPTSGKYETGNLSLLGIKDENNPQAKLAEEKDQALFNYRIEKLQFEEQKRVALSNWKKQRRDKIRAMFIQAAVTIGSHAIAGAIAKPTTGRTLPATGGPNASPQGVYANRGGLIKRFATGGPSGVDDVPALLTGGEYVMRKDTVDQYGSDFFDRLNRGAVSRFAYGGPVGEGNVPALDKSKSEENKTSSTGGLTNNITISVNITNEGSSSSSSQESKSGDTSREQESQGKALSQQIESKVVEVLIQEKRPGGMLYSPKPG